jgi:hypothetical protein
MLDFSDVVIGWGIKVGKESFAKAALVVDLVLEKKHFLGFELANSNPVTLVCRS